MHGYAKSILTKAGEIQASHGEMARIAGGMAPYFNGTLPELLTQRLLDMKKKHEALYEKIAQYSEKIDYAADNYDWSDQEIAGWAGRLNVGVGVLVGGAVTGPGGGNPVTQPAPTAPSTISDPNLNGSAYKEYREGFVADDGKHYAFQCVGYVKGRLQETLGVNLGVPWGNGGDAASNLGNRFSGNTVSGRDGLYSAEYCTPDNIKPGSIASFNTGQPAGHVVYVEDVWKDADGATWVKYSEANADAKGDGGGTDGILQSVKIDDFRNLYNGLKDLLHFEKV
jgi:surface antigen